MTEFQKEINLDTYSTPTSNSKLLKKLYLEVKLMKHFLYVFNYNSIKTLTLILVPNLLWIRHLVNFLQRWMDILQASLV